jgi:hypothetical protein
MPDLECYSNETHIGIMVVGALGLIFYAVGYLAFTYLTLRQIQINQNHDTADQLMAYGSLYDKYKAGSVYFEIVQLVRRGTFGVISALNIPSQMQCVCAQFVISIQLTLHMRFDPYIDRNLNWAEFGLTATSLVLAHCGMVFSVEAGFGPEYEFRSFGLLMHVLGAGWIVVGFSLATVGLFHELFEIMYISYLRKHEFLPEPHGDVNAEATSLSAAFSEDEAAPSFEPHSVPGQRGAKVHGRRRASVTEQTRAPEPMRGDSSTQTGLTSLPAPLSMMQSTSLSRSKTVFGTPILSQRTLSALDPS